jgi:hypothetical protein
MRIKLLGTRNPDNDLLNYYVSKSDVEISVFYHNLPINDCIHQIKNARSKLKDAIKQVTQLRSEFEVHLATAVIEHKHERSRTGEEYDVEEKDQFVKKNLSLGRTDEQPRNHGASWDANYRDISSPTHWTVPNERVSKYWVTHQDRGIGWTEKRQ